MENIFGVILIAVGSIIIYECYITDIIKKIRISKIEKQIQTWFDLIQGDTHFSSSEHIRNHVFDIIQLYKKSNILDENLKFEIAKLLYSYVHAAGGIASSDASIATASSDTNTSHQEENLSHYSKKKELLEKVLVNLFMCIEEDSGRE